MENKKKSCKPIWILLALVISGGLYLVNALRQNIVILRKNEARLKDMLDEYKNK
jgi:hypothetical protein